MHGARTHGTEEKHGCDLKSSLFCSARDCLVVPNVSCYHGQEGSGVLREFVHWHGAAKLLPTKTQFSDG